MSVFTMMLAELLGRATALLLLAFLVAWLLRRRPAGLRHHLWRLTVVALVLLPVVGHLLPHLEFPVLPSPRSTAVDPLGPWPRPTVAPRLDWSGAFPLTDGSSVRQAAGPESRALGVDLVATLLVVVWLAGAFAVGFRTWRARRRAGLYVRLAEPADPAHWPGTRDLRIVESDFVEVPITVGVLFPAVVVPQSGRDWPAAWREAALAHEQAHVQQRDPLFQALAELMVALYWFHPLAWRAARQLRTERELAADDEVLLAGASSSEYARLLVALACTLASAPTAGAVVPLLTPAGLKARLVGILDRHRRRGLRRAGALVLAAGALLVLVPVATAIPIRRPAPTTSQPFYGVRLVPPGEGFVVGRAVDASGQPVREAEVDFILREGVLRTKTDREGLIRSPRDRTHVPAPEFSVYVRKGRLAARKPILAVPYGTALPTTLSLRPAQRVAGFVRTRSGQPVAGAQVAVAAWHSWAEGPGGGPLAVTGSDGSFAIDGMLYGEYELEFQTPWGGTTRFGIRVEDRDVAGLAVTVGNADEPTAWLRNEDGQPLTGVSVTRRFRSEDPVAANSRTGERHVDWDVSDSDGAVHLLGRGGTLLARARDDQGRVIEAAFPDGGSRYYNGPYPYWPARRHANLFGPDSRTVPVVVLQRPAQVSATVRFRDGTPAQATVLLHARDLEGAFPVGSTNASGQTPLLTVYPGSVELRVSHPTLLNSTPERVVLAPGEVRQNVPVVLPIDSAQFAAAGWRRATLLLVSAPTP